MSRTPRRQLASSIAAVIAVGLGATAFAHFQELLPGSDGVTLESGPAVELSPLFTQPVVGGPVMPMERPFDLWQENLFRGVVLRDGEPVPFAMVEVAWRNDGTLDAERRLVEILDDLPRAQVAVGHARGLIGRSGLTELRLAGGRMHAVRFGPGRA